MPNKYTMDIAANAAKAAIVSSVVHQRGCCSNSYLKGQSPTAGVCPTRLVFSLCSVNKDLVSQCWSWHGPIDTTHHLHKVVMLLIMHTFTNMHIRDTSSL